MWETLIGKGPYFNYLTTLDDVIASRGGNPLIVDGKVIGAIGVSGGTGSQDDVLSKAGVAGLFAANFAGTKIPASFFREFSLATRLR